MFESAEGKVAFDFVIIFIIVATTYNNTPLHTVQERKTHKFQLTAWAAATTVHSSDADDHDY